MAFMQWHQTEHEFTCRVVCSDCWHNQPRIALPRKLDGAERDRLWSAAYEELLVVNSSESSECPSCKRSLHKGNLVDYAEELRDPSNNVEVTCDRYVSEVVEEYRREGVVRD